MPLNRIRPLGLLLLLAIVCLALYGCVPNERSVVGTYSSNSDMNTLLLRVNSGGTFVQLDGEKVIGGGRWHLEKAYVVFKSIELDGSYSLAKAAEDIHLDRHSMAYNLVHRGGKLCLDVDQDLLVWCKVK